jgi:hypothetical protein
MKIHVDEGWMSIDERIQKIAAPCFAGLEEHGRLCGAVPCRYGRYCIEFLCSFSLVTFVPFSSIAKFFLNFSLSSLRSSPLI